MTIVIPDWVFFAIVALLLWRLYVLLRRAVSRIVAERRWRIDYYNMAKHRTRFEEATVVWPDVTPRDPAQLTRPAGASSTDPSAETLPIERRP